LKKILSLRLIKRFQKLLIRNASNILRNGMK
jgi:hypothetical protein